MKKTVALLAIIVVLSLIVIVFAQEAKKAEVSKFKYIGVKKCKMCHKGPKKGNIFETWQERSHSKAYATLASDESKEIAKKAGIEGDPQKAAECLSCHVTGYSASADAKMKTLTLEEGVSCEACHGPGSVYKKSSIMKGINKGTMKGTDHGLIEPVKEVCVKCHNPKSPTYKEFVFEEAKKAIAHPLPKKVE